MNERIKELREQAADFASVTYANYTMATFDTNKSIETLFEDKFTELIVRDCIDKIETYRIPVGNSSSGELACEWTYAALKEIRDDIKEHFGVEE